MRQNLPSKKTAEHVLNNNFLEIDWPHLSLMFNFADDMDVLSPLGNGNINDTYKIALTNKNDDFLVLQRLNADVFAHPILVQANFDLVARCLLSQEAMLAVLWPRLTVYGNSLCEINGRYWRVVNGISSSLTVEHPEKISEAYWAANAFGQFDAALAQLDVDRVHEVIPGFHDLAWRLEQLKDACLTNSQNRLKDCAAELRLAETFVAFSTWMPKADRAGDIRAQVAHNDTKINNALLSAETGEALAIIDWDTVMKGYCITDYGDMVRSFTPSMGEDGGPDVEIRWPMLQAVTEGYLEACGDNLLGTEKSALLLGAEWMTAMLGVRFLTDYLNGDVYFKTDDNKHNLRRCQNQFAVLSHLRRERKNWERQLGL